MYVGMSFGLKGYAAGVTDNSKHVPSLDKQFFFNSISRTNFKLENLDLIV